MSCIGMHKERNRIISAHLHPFIEFALSGTPSPISMKSPSPLLTVGRPTKSRRQPKAKSLVLDDQPLVLYASQRGKHLLVLDNYTFSKNNSVGGTTYWACRVVTNHVTCRARVSTTRKHNGMFRVVMSNVVHNHLPKMSRKMCVQSDDDPNVFYIKS